MEDTERIRRAYYVEKKSIRAIAREQGHHRRVVREAIAGTTPRPRRYRRQKPRPHTMVGPVAHLIEAWLEADRDAPPKQRHTAKRIYDRLVAEHGYSGKDASWWASTAPSRDAPRALAAAQDPRSFRRTVLLSCGWAWCHDCSDR